MTDSSKPTYKQIAAAWIRRTKYDEDMLAIRFNEDVVLKAGEFLNLWKNRRKFKPNHPDFSLVERTDPGKPAKKPEPPAEPEETPSVEEDIYRD